MAPRKSNASVTNVVEEDNSTMDVEGDSAIVDGGEEPGKRGRKKKQTDDKETMSPIEDLYMPRTMIGRLARGVLPAHTNVQKDAVTAITKGATLFISHITAAATSHTSADWRKTISPNDLFAGLRDTEYEFMIEKLELELAKYNEVQTGKRSEYRQKLKEDRAKAKGGPKGGDTSIMVGKDTAGHQSQNEESAGPRPAKRARLENEETDGDDAEDAHEDEGEEGDEAENEEEEEEEEEDEDGQNVGDGDEDEEMLDKVGSEAENGEDESMDDDSDWGMRALLSASGLAVQSTAYMGYLEYISNQEFLVWQRCG